MNFTFCTRLCVCPLCLWRRRLCLILFYCDVGRCFSPERAYIRQGYVHNAFEGYMRGFWIFSMFLCTHIYSLYFYVYLCTVSHTEYYISRGVIEFTIVSHTYIYDTSDNNKKITKVLAAKKK